MNDIDIERITSELMTELLTDSEQRRQQAVGVKLLYDRIREQAAKAATLPAPGLSSITGGKAQAEKPSSGTNSKARKPAPK